MAQAEPSSTLQTSTESGPSVVWLTSALSRGAASVRSSRYRLQRAVRPRRRKAWAPLLCYIRNLHGRHLPPLLRFHPNLKVPLTITRTAANCRIAVHLHEFL